MADCSRILAQYIGSLEDKISIEPEGEDCILTTPFLSPDNDPIQIRVAIKGDTAEMSDMGESIGFLFLHGVDLKPNSRQRWFFDTTLRRFGRICHGQRDCNAGPNHRPCRLRFAIN